jgi:hypothetical protein
MPKSLEDILKQAKEATDPAAMDSDLAQAAELAKGNTSADTRASIGSTPFTPDVQVRPPNSEGFSSGTLGHDPFNPDVVITPPPSSADQNVARTKKARGATKQDLANLTEADILNMPFIEASNFDVPAMLQLRPKDGGIRFRWVNYKNYEGGNYDMFKAIGFTNASTADVEGPVQDSLLKEDGTIKWFDVILMKVDLLRIMGVYKKNIIRSLEMVGRWQKTAIAQARRTIENEAGSDIWEQLKSRNQTVEFYAPSVSEMKSQDADFK